MEEKSNVDNSVILLDSTYKPGTTRAESLDKSVP